MNIILNTSLIKTWQLPSPFLRIVPSPYLRNTLAIFSNYPRHLSELPSPFLRITLAITLWIALAYRITLAIWSIFPTRIEGYTSMNSWNCVSIPVVVLLLTTGVTMASSCTWETGQFDITRVGFPGSAILTRVIRNTLARWCTVHCAKISILVLISVNFLKKHTFNVWGYARGMRITSQSRCVNRKYTYSVCTSNKTRRARNAASSSNGDCGKTTQHFYHPP